METQTKNEKTIRVEVARDDVVFLNTLLYHFCKTFPKDTTDKVANAFCKEINRTEKLINKWFAKFNRKTEKGIRGE